MSLKIVTVTIDVIPAVLLLVAGYLQSYAYRDQEIKASCEFEAHFLTATSSFLSTACISVFLTTVFQPLRYEVVQAYGRLAHFLCHEDRPAAGSCLRELVSTQLKRILRRRMNFVGGIMRIRHPQKQKPLSDMHYGSSRHWNYRSFRMITSRPLAATWEDTQVAAKAA